MSMCSSESQTTMFKIVKVILLMTIPLLGVGAHDMRGGGQSRADSLFAEGETLIQENCGECVGSTQEGLEAGVELIVKALEHGYDDREAAYRLLVSAYRQLAFFFTESGSHERKKFRQLYEDSLEELSTLAPTDTEVLNEYEGILEGPERLAVLERILEIDPDNSAALYSLGREELRRGLKEQGLTKLRRAFRTAAVDRAPFYGERLAWILQSQGLDEEAAEVLKAVAKIKKDLGYPVPAEPENGGR